MKRRYLIFRLHHNDWREAAFIGDMPGHKAVAKVQANAAKMGWRTGITWQVHEGDLVSALLATVRI